MNIKKMLQEIRKRNKDCCMKNRDAKKIIRVENCLVSTETTNLIFDLK